MSWRPTTAMVLAAGLGVRMRPLTHTIPKPLVVLSGVALIDRVLDRLAAASVERAVVNVHHHAGLLEAHLAPRAAPQIIISDERSAVLDTGGGVARALPHLGTDAFLIHNSDSVWIEGVGSNLERLFRHWNSDEMDCLMLLALSSSSLGYDGQGDFSMSPDGRLRRRAEREVAPFAFTGVSIAHPRIFEAAPEGPFSMNRLWDVAIEHDRLFGLRLDGLWMHVGTPQALEDAESWIKHDEAG